MACRSELPYIIRRLQVRCSRDSNKYSIKNKAFEIYVSERTNVYHLREYLSQVKLVEGRYYFKGDYIDHGYHRFIKVENEDTLEIKDYRERQGNLLEVSLQFYLNEKKDLLVPRELTFRLLKFIIQSEVFIKMENQSFRRHHSKWEVCDSYTLHVPDDFEDLIVEDISYFKSDYRSFSIPNETTYSDIGKWLPPTSVQ